MDNRRHIPAYAPQDLVAETGNPFAKDQGELAVLEKKLDRNFGLLQTLRARLRNKADDLMGHEPVPCEAAHDGSGSIGSIAPPRHQMMRLFSVAEMLSQEIDEALREVSRLERL